MAETKKKKKVPNGPYVAPNIVFRTDDEKKLFDNFLKVCKKESRDFTKQVKHEMKNAVERAGIV